MHSSTTTVAPIAERDSRDGPLTQQRLTRSLALYGALALIGSLLALAAPPFWQGFGLGLILPGGGFLAAMTSAGSAIGFGAAFLFTLLLFGIAFLAWFGSGNVLAPILVWLGAAVLAGLSAPVTPWSGAVWVLLAAVAAGFALGRRHQLRAQRQALADRQRRNTMLAARAAAVSPQAASEVRELTPEALGLLRHVLDRALQPVDRFDGIDWVDQFQFGALRYALCGMGYALSSVHYGATPAFRGYLSEAQQRLHTKMLDHRVWKYWVLENLWGNLERDANPIHHRDNIMYHGWYMAMLGEYISNTGDDRYNRQPLRLRHRDGREWRYTFSEICEVLYRSHRKSPFTLFPCEPNWIYPMCNNFSAVALKIHDRLYGTQWWAEIESDYRRNFDNEFCTVDGRVLAIRSAHTGITLPMLTSAMADCVTAHFQHGSLPDIARRSWEIARMDFIKQVDDDVQIQTKGWDNIDTGSYKPSMITTYTQVGAAAAEMGDEEVSGLLRQRVLREFRWHDEDGASRIEGVSTQAHAIALCHFAAHPNLRRNMHARGIAEREMKGPLLIGAPYPQVLVTYAHNDGEALQLVLRPGQRHPESRPAELHLGQLRPGQRYRCVGLPDGDQLLVADGHGEATLSLHVDQRRVLRIAPEA